MNDPSPVARALQTKLHVAFSPASLEIVDDSARHAGHSGAREGGETHFKVRIVSDAFAKLSRVERQRKVYAVLAEELSTRVHALQLVTLTPEEAARA